VIGEPPPDQSATDWGANPTRAAPLTQIAPAKRRASTLPIEPVTDVSEQGAKRAKAKQGSSLPAVVLGAVAVLGGLGAFFALRSPTEEPIPVRPVAPRSVVEISPTPAPAISGPVIPDAVAVTSAKETVDLEDEQEEAVDRPAPTPAVLPSFAREPTRRSAPVSSASSTSSGSSARALKSAAVAKAASNGPGQIRVVAKLNGASSWAWIEVNGSKIGTAPRVLSLPAGKHKVRATRDGFKTQEEEVVVTSGKPLLVEFNLKP
jgi:hypothetical protein